MGKTQPTYRNEIESFEDEYSTYRKALRRQRQEHFDAVFRQIRELSHTGQSLTTLDRREAMLLSVLIMQEERIAALEDELDMEVRFTHGRDSEDLNGFISQD